MLEFRLLGPVELAVDGEPVPLGPAKRRAVLAALAVDAGRPVPVAALIDRVWGEQPPPEARNTLYSHVARLRRLLAEAGAAQEAVLVRRSGAYLLDVDENRVDLLRVRRLVERARGSSDARERVSLLRGAVGLWRGDALVDVPGAWAERARDRVDEQRVATLVLWGSLELELGGDPEVVLERVADAVTRHPLAEPLIAVQLRALFQAGRAAEALSRYAVTRRRMVEELGTEPGPELQALHEALLRGELDRPGTPVAPARTVPAQLPRDSVAFTGREAEMDRLVRAVTETGESGVIAVHAVAGMAGVGKTALAIHAGHALAERFPDGQLFVRLHAHTPGQEPADPADVLASLLVDDGVTASMVPVLEDTRATLDARASLWRSRMAGRRTLLVLDDAADEAQIRPLFPGAPGCLVLITSRRRLAGLPDAVAVALDTLSPPEAARLFTTLSEVGGRRVDPAEHGVVVELVRRCGHLPLAIAVLAGRLRQHPAWHLSDLVGDLDAARDRLAVLCVRDIAVAAALDLSYERLPPERQRLFRRLSLHPGADLDAYAAAALDDIDPAEAIRHLEALHDEHLVMETAPGRYRMHDLVREYAAGRCAEDPASDRDKARGQLLDYYQRMAEIADSHVSPLGGSHRRPRTGVIGAGPGLHDRRTAMAWMRAERSNVLVAAAHCRQVGEHRRLIALASAMATFLHLAGPWDRATSLYEAAAAAADRIGDHGRQAGALMDLATVRYYAGLHPQAIEAVTRAEGRYARCGDRRGQAYALNLLGELLGSSERYPEGLAAIGRALEIFRKVGDRNGEAAAHMELGGARTFIGDYAVAEEHLTRALAIQLEVDDRQALAKCYNYLGTLLFATCDYPAAADALRQAMELAEQVGDRAGVAGAHIQLSAVRRLTGDYAAAVAAATAAARVCSEIGNRGGEAVCLAQIGAIRRLTGDYPGASDVLTRALRTFVEIDSRHNQATVLVHLGAVRRLTGDHRVAAEMLSRAMGICADLGNVRSRATALNQVAALRWQTGDRAAAAEALTAALTIWRDIGDARGEAEALNISAEMSLGLGDTHGALAQYENAMQVARRIGDPLQEAHAIAGSGWCALHLDDRETGLDRLRQALEIYRRLGVAEFAPLEERLRDL